jgi:16S rRNA (guanine(966)-N(2))-methyltransferase RsmD
MRVTGGTLKSRQIRSPKGRSARPTSDRVRESLFAVIEGDVVDSCVLDLFAGPGTLGIEAISRGASFVTFVERSREVASVLRTNLRSLCIEDRASVRIEDSLEAVRRFSAGRASFGLVLLDPPYSVGLAAEALQRIMEGGIVTEGGVVAVEHSKRDSIQDSSVGFALDRVLEFGDTQVSIYRRKECGK